jgi:predicted transcriptional regulator
MSDNVSSRVANLIHEHMALGKYDSEDELLISALEALKERNEADAAIQAGIDDMEAGRVRPFQEVAEEIARKHSF